MYNLKEIIKNKGYTIKSFASEIGLPYTTLLSMLNNGISKSSVDNVIKIAQRLNIRVEDLTSGLENKVISQKSSSFDYYEIPRGASKKFDDMAKLPMMNVPDAWLGKYARNRNIVMMHVNGESMNNVIKRGTVIAVLTHMKAENIHNGDMVVAKSENSEYTVERLYRDAKRKKIVLRPNSSDLSFHDIILDSDNIKKIDIFGKVVAYSSIM